jgi:putative ABC transport system substrate-binding protein
MNNRRKFLAVLGTGAIAAPLVSFSQTQGKIPRVGVLSVYPPGKDPQFEAFKQQLRDLGHVEGKTIAIDYLSVEGKYDRLPALAAELVKRNVDVIMAISGTPPANAARNAARTTPIVFTGVSDPVGQDLVTSLARPGGNITGTSNQHPETAAKFLTLLKEVVPSAKRIAVLTNPMNSSLPLVLTEMQAAARKLRMELIVVNAKAPAEFERAFAEIVRDRAAALVIFGDPLFTVEAGRLATLAAKHRLPTMGGINIIPESGGLMSYGADRLDLVRRAAVMVDKILKGAKPADLPVEQPMKFDLVLNKRTARDLGLKITNSILVQATKVIE